MVSFITRRGPELRADSGMHPVFGQSITALSDGGFAIAWMQDQVSATIVVQRFDPDGVLVGDLIVVAGGIGETSIAGLATGGFVVTWADGGVVEARTYDADGSPTSDSFIVVDDAFFFGDSHVFALPAGGFVVSWVDEGNVGAGTGYNIHSRMFDDDGTAIGDVIEVNSNLTGFQSLPTGTALASGGFVIAWYDQEPGDGDPGLSIKGQVFDASGSPIGDNFLINSVVESSQSTPDIAALPGGGFVAVWQSYVPGSVAAGTPGTDQAKIQIFDADGEKVGEELLASTPGDSVSACSVTVLDWGGILVAWDNNVGPNFYSVNQQAQLFDPQGNRLGLPSEVNGVPSDYNGHIDLAALPSGEVVAAWKNGNPYLTPENLGIKVQLLSMPAVGTVGVDVLVGTDEEDRIAGLAGNDQINGGIGADGLAGGHGDDVLDGGSDDDLLIGHAGSDVLVGGDGNDRLFSGEVSGFVGSPQVGESLDKGAEADALSGGDGDDYLFAGYGDDVDGGSDGPDGDRLYISFLGASSGVVADFRLLGSEASITIGGGTIADVEYVEYVEGSRFGDFIAGWAGASNSGATTIYGRGGNDHIVADISAGSADGRIYGGEGDDLIDLTAPAVGPRAYGEAGNDRLLGGSGSNWLEGGAGKDFLEGRGGADELYGDAGNDTLKGGGSGDRLYGGAGKDTIYGDSGADTVDGGEGDDLIYGDFGPASSGVADPAADYDILLGGAGSDTIYGGHGNDVLNGGLGVDVLNGGAGVDILIGDLGSDIYYVDRVADAVIESAEGGTDRVYSSVSFTLSAEVEGLVLTGSGATGGYGNASANEITGNGGNNVLNGRGGNDLLRGGAGNDRLSGQAGNDQLEGGAGHDRFYFDAAPGVRGVDRILDFSAVHDSFFLDRDVFGGIGAKGVLSAGAFRLGTSARDSDDRILYDKMSGKIYFDADGSGAAAPVLFAVVDAKTALTHADFIIYS